MSDEKLINSLRESINIDDAELTDTEDISQTEEPTSTITTSEEVIPNSVADEPVGTIACEPEELALQAKLIRTKGVELNNAFLNAFRRITEMHTCWHGKSYNLILTEFNKIIADVNKLIRISIEDVPTDLEKIANLFAEADGRYVVTKVNRETCKSINSLEIINDDSFKFVSEEVERKKNEIISDFSQAKSIMVQIVDCLRNISWNDDSAKQFADSIEDYSIKLAEDFDELIRKFNIHLQGQIDAVNRAESANMF